MDRKEFTLLLMALENYVKNKYPNFWKTKLFTKVKVQKQLTPQSRESGLKD